MPIQTGPGPDRHLLSSLPWRASPSPQGGAEAVLHFLPDGGIGAGSSVDPGCPAGVPGARRWSVADGRLLLHDRDGRVLAVFACPPADPLEAERARRAGAAPERSLLREDAGPGARALSALAAEPAAGASAAARIRVSDRAPRRRDLVVLHAGAGCRFDAWARDLPPDAERSWDLCLVWHDRPDGHPDHPDARYHAVLHGAPRWRAMHRLFPPAGPLRHHDHVVLLDGGTGWRWGGVERALALARAHRPGLAGPVPDAVPAGGEAVLFSRAALAACAPGFAADDDRDGESPDAAAARRAARWAARLGWPEPATAIPADAPIRAWSAPRGTAGAARTAAGSPPPRPRSARLGSGAAA